MDFFTLIGLVVVVIALLALVATETYLGAAAVLFVALMYVLFSYGITPAVTLLMANLPMLLVYASAYIGAGVVWSFFKWDRFVARRASSGYSQPAWKDHKGSITGWTVWWPFSIISYVIGDLLADVVRWIQNLFGNIYAKIAARHYPVVRKDQ